VSHYTRPERLAEDNYFCLLGPLVSYKENKVLRIWYQVEYFQNYTKASRKFHLDVLPGKMSRLFLFKRPLIMNDNKKVFCERADVTLHLPNGPNKLGRVSAKPFQLKCLRVRPTLLLA
jgi:hypothetical protein